MKQTKENYEICYYFLISILTAQLKDICKEYYERMYLCEGQKWDLEHEVRKRDWEVLPKNKTKQKYRIQNIYKTSLILFDKIIQTTTKHKQNLLSPIFLLILIFILIPQKSSFRKS